jgi:hypothetical protein
MSFEQAKAEQETRTIRGEDAVIWVFSSGHCAVVTIGPLPRTHRD